MMSFDRNARLTMKLIGELGIKHHLVSLRSSLLVLHAADADKSSAAGRVYESIRRLSVDR